MLEVNNGNLHAVVGGDAAEDSHAIVKIGQFCTVVEAMTPRATGKPEAVRFGPEGMSISDGDIEPGCVDEDPAPSI